MINPTANGRRSPRCSQVGLRLKVGVKRRFLANAQGSAPRALKQVTRDARLSLGLVAALGGVAAGAVCARDLRPLLVRVVTARAFLVPGLLVEVLSLGLLVASRAVWRGGSAESVPLPLGRRVGPMACLTTLRKGVVGILGVLVLVTITARFDSDARLFGVGIVALGASLVSRLRALVFDLMTGLASLRLGAAVRLVATQTAVVAIHGGCLLFVTTRAIPAHGLRVMREAAMTFSAALMPGVVRRRLHL